jgi:ABC-type cobalamin transport system permease subunit
MLMGIAPGWAQSPQRVVTVSLGVDTRTLGLRLTLGVGLMVCAATSIAGVIGFVGLAAPHLCGRGLATRPAPPWSRPCCWAPAPFLVRAIHKSRASWLAT